MPIPRQLERSDSPPIAFHDAALESAHLAAHSKIVTLLLFPQAFHKWSR